MHNFLLGTCVHCFPRKTLEWSCFSWFIKFSNCCGLFFFQNKPYWQISFHNQLELVHYFQKTHECSPKSWPNFLPSILEIYGQLFKIFWVVYCQLLCTNSSLWNFFFSPNHEKLTVWHPYNFMKNSEQSNQLKN